MQQACVVCGARSDQNRCSRHRRGQADRRAQGLTGQRGSTRAWRSLREQVLERDAYRCTQLVLGLGRCPHTEDLHVDHVIAKEDGGRDVESNLRTLCRDHHVDRHRKENSL